MPNIFDHGGSELSQDAILAYIIEWANPEFAAANPEMHSLGRRFLLALLNRARQAEGLAAFPEDFPIDNLTLMKQHKVNLLNGGRGLIDLLVVINGTIHLVIEDKVNCLEASNQIHGYREALRAQGIRDVLAVYVKTGNESPPLAEPPSGRFMRSDLLAVIDDPLPNDCVVRQFHEHLHKREAATESFRTIPPDQWSGLAVEGFLGWVTTHLRGHGNPDAEWSYQNNPYGGEWVCVWKWLPFQGLNHHCYLQVTHPPEDAPRLHVRIYSQVGPLLALIRDAARNALLAIPPDAAQRPGLHATHAQWNGRGQSARLVQLTFDQGNSYGWIPLTPEGLVDLKATEERLIAASLFLSAAIP